MKIDANTPVKVYNHGVSDIGMRGQLREYYLNGSRGIPTVLTMPFSEVEYINSRSPVFRTGALQFDPEQRDDVYAALYLDNWQNAVLFDEEIERIIRENDMDAAQKFVDVTDIFTIQRIRGHMMGLVNDDSIDVSQRMIKLIDTRYDEINNGVRHSKIDISKEKARAKATEDPRISILQDQIAALQKQISDMQNPASTAPKTSTSRRSTRKTLAKQESESDD